MTITNSPADAGTVRHLTTGNRHAVLVLSQISGNKYQYGIQFWTRGMVQAGEAMNSDGTTSIFCKLIE